MPYKIDFKAKSISRDKDDHYIMIKVSSGKYNNSKLYALNNIVSKYIDNFTIIEEDCN